MTHPAWLANRTRCGCCLMHEASFSHNRHRSACRCGAFRPYTPAHLWLICHLFAHRIAVILPRPWRPYCVGNSTIRLANAAY